MFKKLLRKNFLTLHSLCWIFHFLSIYIHYLIKPNFILYIDVYLFEELRNILLLEHIFYKICVLN